MKIKYYILTGCSVLALIGCGGGDKEYAGTWASDCRPSLLTKSDGSTENLNGQIYYVVKKISDGNFSVSKVKRFFVAENCAGKYVAAQINDSKRNLISFAGTSVIGGVSVDRVNIFIENENNNEFSKDIVDVDSGSLYFGDKKSALDSAGYPTKLDRDNHFSKQLLIAPSPDTPQEGEGGPEQ